MNNLTQYLSNLMEKIESKSGSEEIFHSDYGIKFQMQYEELLEYISVGSIIPATINFYQPINELLSNPTKIKDPISGRRVQAIRLT